jgi:imidazolonepropionase
MVPNGTPYGAVMDASVAISAGRVYWVGPAAEMPDSVTGESTEIVDGGGGWLTPGLIDCHTHLVFGGDRAHEFELRLAGASYEEIARAGGGIVSTVVATRSASDEELFEAAAERLGEMMEQGITTVEIKSGYGLDVETELRMLAIARRLGDALPVTVSATLLGAHALPVEYQKDRAAYIALITDEMIPRAATAGLADAVDAFCEGIGFSPDECETVFEAAQAHGLPIRLHADQLSDLGGAALAARFHARSADHLEYTSEAGAQSMADADTVAVLLPGAFHFLQEPQKPPVATFRKAGVRLAVASDFNPGSSPVGSPLVTLNLACVLFGLTPEEALAGMTYNAAPVLGLQGEAGVVVEGLRADLALWDVGRPAELCYWLGRNPCRAVIRGGAVVHTS